MRKQWSDVLERVEGLYATAKKEAGTLWFRGQRRADWPLRSSAHRFVEEQFKTLGGRADLAKKQRQLREQYKSDFYLFKADALPLLKPIERNSWGIVFARSRWRLRSVGMKLCCASGNQISPSPTSF